MRTASGHGNDSRKILTFYRANFGVLPPYDVLCDGPTIALSFKNKLYLKQALPQLLGRNAYVVVTDCIVRELRNLGSQFSGAALFAKRAKRVPCMHSGEVSVSECIIKRIKEQPEKPLLLAANDIDILKGLGATPGFPLISIANNTKFVLRPPSKASLQFVENEDKEKMNAISAADKLLVDTAIDAERQSKRPMRKKRKRKQVKGPNPLSVKKSKKAKTCSPGTVDHSEQNGSLNPKGKKGSSESVKVSTQSHAKDTMAQNGKKAAENTSASKRPRKRRRKGSAEGNDVATNENSASNLKNSLEGKGPDTTNRVKRGDSGSAEEVCRKDELQRSKSQSSESREKPPRTPESLQGMKSSSNMEKVSSSDKGNTKDLPTKEGSSAPVDTPRPSNHDIRESHVSEGAAKKKKQRKNRRRRPKKKAENEPEDS